LTTITGFFRTIGFLASPSGFFLSKSKLCFFSSLAGFSISFSHYSSLASASSLGFESVSGHLSSLCFFYLESAFLTCFAMPFFAVFSLLVASSFSSAYSVFFFWVFSFCCGGFSFFYGFSFFSFGALTFLASFPFLGSSSLGGAGGGGVVTTGGAAVAAAFASS
jgi:hypothetical protein